MDVKVKRISNSQNNFSLPEHKTEGAAGMDLYADLTNQLQINAGKVELIPTGIALEIPSGYECQIRSRSGLSLKDGLFCLNSPGTIDSDYRGEIKVIIANFSKEDKIINPGDRIAQMVFARYEEVKLIEVEELDETSRGIGGFGSTGTN